MGEAGRKSVFEIVVRLGMRVVRSEVETPNQTPNTFSSLTFMSLRNRQTAEQ